MTESGARLLLLGASAQAILDILTPLTHDERAEVMREVQAVLHGEQAVNQPKESQ